MVWLILLTALCFAVFTGFVTQQAGKALLDKEVQLLNRIAEGYVNNIEILLDTYRDKVRLVATRTRLRQLLAENNGATSSLERVSTMSKILNDAITGDPEIDLIVITDLANRFITSTDLELLDLSEKQKVTLLGEPTGNITEPAIDTLHEFDQVYLIVTTAIELDGKVIGLLRARVNPTTISRSIESAQFGASGEILLGLHSEDGDTYFVTGTRNNRGAEATKLASVMENSVPMIRAFGGNQAPLIDNAVDYAGVPVIAVTRKITSMDWALVAKLNRDEVFAGIRNVKLAAILSATLLFVFAGLITWIYTRKVEESHVKLQTELDRRHRSDAQFMELFEAAAGAMLVVSDEGRITSVNEKCVQLFGYSTSEMQRMPVEELMPEELREHHKGYRAGYSRNPSIRMMNQGNSLKALRKDGKTITVAIDLRPIETEQGTSVVVTINDQTAELKAQKNIEQQAEALMRSNEELDQFAYVASHDLKAPLRGIAQLATIIEEDCEAVLPQESRADLQLLRSRVKRMEQLLDSLLQYSRIGRSEREYTQINLHELLNDVAQLYLPDDRFELEIIGSLPEVAAPRTALEIVFRNLMMNSVKHHDRDRGKVTIQGEVTNKLVSITLLDDGPGFPAEFNEKAFQLFQTMKRRDEVEGSGMGLALARKTMQSLDGSIDIVPLKGRGCCFHLQWPYRQMGSEPRPVNLKLVAESGS